MGNTLLITDIGQLILATQFTPRCKGGTDQAEVPTLQNAFLLILEGHIHSFGPMSQVPEGNFQVISAAGSIVLPAWVDSHTHIVYAASREEEFVNRIKGLSYEEIARQGGGILNSAQKMQSASEQKLFEDAFDRLEEVIGMGTGSIEVKSGYGLTVDSELKMLRVIQRLKEVSPIPVKSTFLGAHAYPAEFKNNHQGYIDLIIQEMLPNIAREGLADYIDVFCDRGFFNPEETGKILEAGYKYGLKAKIHANELDYSGGVQIGVKHNAVSVDHLECVGPAEIEALKGSVTLATLLPSTAFFLDIKYAPARALIDNGIPVVLATDYNPGSTPSGNMPFVLSLACIKMKMLPEEAVKAATVHGAYALELEDQVGSISPGKLGNVIITKPVPSLAFLPYAFGSNWIRDVVIGGKIFAKNHA
jgi:imidazolonepropionase